MPNYLTIYILKTQKLKSRVGNAYIKTFFSENIIINIAAVLVYYKLVHYIIYNIILYNIMQMCTCGILYNIVN